ncbi:hypothetical protein LTR85_010253 [Meristemomyces frigidus]|nr:hypothetical protein LTR85_010253 [Meristemomyces frigidus]
MAKATTTAKYQGYAALSRYIDSADGMMIFRRFGELHVRNLLYMQDEITLLEDKLHARDLLDGEHGCRRRDTDLERRGLMKQLRSRLKEYGLRGPLAPRKTKACAVHGTVADVATADEAVLSTAAMRKFGSPKDRPMRTLKAFLEATRPLVEDEEPVIKHNWDLLCLKTWEDAFPTWVTETLRIGDWTRLTHSRDQQAKFESLNIDTEGLQMLFISSARIRRLMRALVTFSGCLFLLVPIILLFFLHTDAAQLIIIVCSLLLFTTVTAALTSAKNWEVVAASIAYDLLDVLSVLKRWADGESQMDYRASRRGDGRAVVGSM